MIFKPQFSSDGVLPEYPRPQKKRDSYINLNGEWDYAFSPSDNFVDSFDGKIIVPYSPESKLSGVNRQLAKNEFLHLRKTFTLPSGFNKGRILFNVGACDQTCKVYFNGKFSYENFDGYTSFTVELKNPSESENEIYLIVSDDADSDVYGRGKQRYKRGGIWYTAISGTWQTCFLESVPENYIKDFKYDINYDEKTLTVSCGVVGNKVAEVTVFDGQNIVDSGKTVDGKVVLNVEACKSWSLDNPELYPVVIKTDEDAIESYFGLRKFSKILVDGKYYFAINDEPVFLNGLLDQGYFGDGIYTPKRNEDVYNEVATLKTAGFNMLRKHIKVESALWYYYCDILGVAVFQDMINGGGEYSKLRINLGPFIDLRLNDKDYVSMKRGNIESRKQYLYEANRLIDQLYNVPSLFLWTPFNEGWGQFDAYDNWKILSKKDTSRLFDHASGWQDKGGGDVNSKHVYFKKVKPKNDYKRVLAVTEFGGYSYELSEKSGRKFGYKTFKSRDKLKRAYEKLYLNEIIPSIINDGLSSCCYTQVSDVEDEINGLFTSDRILKLDVDFLKNINDKVFAAFYKSLGIEK